MTGRRGRRRRKLLDDLKERRGYSHLKEEALDRIMWRARFGRCFGPAVRPTTKWWVNYKEALSLRCPLTTAWNYVRIGNISASGNFTFVCYRILSSVDILLCNGTGTALYTLEHWTYPYCEVAKFQFFFFSYAQVMKIWAKISEHSTFPSENYICYLLEESREMFWML